nr:hypothetical protein GCM10017745_64800 [Saccharothrix mutabilis subsp. capreolus]
MPCAEAVGAQTTKQANMPTTSAMTFRGRTDLEELRTRMEGPPFSEGFDGGSWERSQSKVQPIRYRTKLQRNFP